MPARPSSIGPYRIVEELGMGGMARLYGAEIDGDGRRVALKVIHPHLAKESRFVDMFMDEARVLGLIDHPNVVRVERYAKSRDTHYMVMEYVDGLALGTIMEGVSRAGRRFEVPVAVRIAERALAGLHAAHECRRSGRHLEVVHRDVSPQNILVGRDGRVKLIDFGVARAEGRLHETNNGNIKGKLRYMAPEHCTGKNVDRRTDVYSLAIVLWEMLALRPYFGGDSEPEVVKAVRAPRYRRVARPDGALGADLEEVLRIALHPNPENRFQSAAAFQRALVAACPEAEHVDADRIAAFVSGVGTNTTRVSRRVPRTATGPQRRAALAYTFCVEVPRGGHDVDTPATKILDLGTRRVAPGGGRAARAQLLGLAAAALVVCFLSGVTGVAIGHAFHSSETIVMAERAPAATPHSKRRGDDGWPGGASNRP